MGPTMVDATDEFLVIEELGGGEFKVFSQRVAVDQGLLVAVDAKKVSCKIQVENT